MTDNIFIQWAVFIINKYIISNKIPLSALSMASTVTPFPSWVTNWYQCHFKRGVVADANPAKWRDYRHREWHPGWRADSPATLFPYPIPARTL